MLNKYFDVATRRWRDGVAFLTNLQANFNTFHLEALALIALAVLL
jgi:hypothetical protein